jgi:hypothetical protein
MLFRGKIWFVTLGIVAQLWLSGFVMAAELQASDGAPQREIVAQHPITLVSLDPWVIEGEIMGAVAAYVYNDVTTHRPADYWEIYDTEGNLIAVSWFDRLGSRKIAVDRGIVEQEDKLEGVLVEVVEGDPA